ncbi:Uncharacterised protein [Mycobacteroides abscessus subsp. abscessus]|nr:Uncharacterised protein [Mycobacteroides abscessus subsp. abscessus]
MSAPQPRPSASTTIAPVSTARTPAFGNSRSPTLAPTISPPIIGSNRSPLPSASVPSTSWKYCGTVKNNPNSAKLISTANTAPHLKPGARNRPGSMSGCVARRCQATSAAPATRPAATQARASGSPHPCSPQRISP